MKKILTLVALFGLLASAPVVQTGCSTAPSERVQVVQTLKVAGASAEAAVELSARLYQSGTITAEQARKVADFYNQQFQPAYRLAVTAAQGDLSSYSSPALWALLTQLSLLVNSYQSNP